MIQDVDAYLVEWARWIRSDWSIGKIGSPIADAVLYGGAPPKGQGPKVEPENTIAETMDGALGRLEMVQPQWKRAIVDSFLHKRVYHAIAKDLAVSVPTVKLYIKMGKVRLAGHIWSE